VEAIELTKYFDMGRNQRVHAVDNVSLAIAEKELVGLVGESGSGKSTFGKTVIGLHDKTSGTVKYRGETLPQSLPGSGLPAACLQNADDISGPLFLP